MDAECLGSYLKSQQNNLADSFKDHCGKMPCVADTECGGLIARDAAVGLLVGEARVLFLRGVELRAEKRAWEEAEAEMEKLRAKLDELQSERQEDVRVAKHMRNLEKLQVDECPGCGVAFVDKAEDACFVLFCRNPECKDAGRSRKMCGWCMADLGYDNKEAHNHVRACALNKNPGSYFGQNRQQFDEAVMERRKTRTRDYMHTEVDSVDQAALLKQAASILDELGLGKEQVSEIEDTAFPPRLFWEHHSVRTQVRLWQL